MCDAACCVVSCCETRAGFTLIIQSEEYKSIHQSPREVFVGSDAGGIPQIFVLVENLVTLPRARNERFLVTR